jgi:hypothetical protein
MCLFDRLILNVGTVAICRDIPTKHKASKLKVFTRFGGRISKEDLSVTRSFYVFRAKKPQRTRMLVTARSCVQLTGMNGPV